MNKKLIDEVAEKIKGWVETEEVRSVISATEKAAAEDTGTFEMVITTENVDRYGEVIKLDAWEDEAYMKNPVVLWGHDHSIPPIGVTTGLRTENGKKIATGKFAPNAFAQELRKSYEMGFLFASSVGFIEKEREGNLITKAELIEWSFVSVPANPYALGLAMEKGLNINELVTKGFLSIKEAEPVVQQEEPKDEEDVVEEKKFSTKAVTPIVEQLKSVIIALEALTDEEPEREGEAEPTEEEKALAEFTEKRRIIQEAVTIISDDLATRRRALKEALKM